MPLKTPFRLVIGFITILQVVTTITYYTIARLHNLQSLHTNLLAVSAVVFMYSVSLNHTLQIESSIHTLYLHILTLRNLLVETLWELPANWSECRFIRLETETVSADGLQDNSSARPTQKSHLTLYCCKGVFTDWLPGNGRGMDSIENSRSDCCLVTSNNICNSIVACIYATEGCLQVVA
jgi:hypothetical protein